jgi:hypothetical protein
MALFSRKKSKAKKASKEEEKKAAAEAKSAAATKPSQRGTCTNRQWGDDARYPCSVTTPETF